MSQYSYNFTVEEQQRLINSIPEVGVIDSYKENIQPRKEGRNAAVLSEFLELDTSEKEQELRKGHGEFKEELEKSKELDDPLAVYLDYIDWILHHYPQGHTKESNLLPTLKAATEEFVDDGRYKNHPSYLKVCLEYAKWVEEPQTIYHFLISNDIGQNLALFYEEYASYLERKLKYDGAEEIYKRGLSKGAIPKGRLEKSFQQFKDRIKEREKKKLIKQRNRQEAHEQTEALKSAGRTMLGVKYSSESRASQPANVFNRTQSLYGSPTPSSLSPSSPSTSSSSSAIGRNFSTSTPSPQSMARQTDAFRVFKETPTSDLNSTVLPTGTPRLLAVRSSSTHTENKARAESFSGVTIKQAPFTPPPVERFSIFRDGGSSTPNSPAPTTPLERGLSFNSEGEPTTTSIRKKPLSSEVSTKQKRKKTKENPVSKFNLERFNKYKNNYIEAKDSHGKIEIICAFKHPPGVSYEELRALSPKYARPPVQSKTVTVGEDDEFFSGDIPESTTERTVRESSPTNEITAETRRARESMYTIFGSDTTHDDEDVTWTKEYQTFKPFVPKQVDENEHPY